VTGSGASLMRDKEYLARAVTDRLFALLPPEKAYSSIRHKSQGSAESLDSQERSLPSVSRRSMDEGIALTWLNSTPSRTA
jgi:hypothetical protein